MTYERYERKKKKTDFLKTNECFHFEDLKLRICKIY